METKKHYCRDIFSLSNQEIVKLVDFIFDDINLDRLAGYLYEERPSLTKNLRYRKIEVYSSFYDWAFIVKITYLFEELNREITTGFLIGMEGGPGDDQIYNRDIYIQSVTGFYKTMEGYIWEKGVADDFGIEVDFSVFQVYVRKFQRFLNDTLNLWSDKLSQDNYEWNPQLKDLFEENTKRSFIVEENQFAESLE
jgi:hypothetical protein